MRSATGVAMVAALAALSACGADTQSATTAPAPSSTAGGQASGALVTVDKPDPSLSPPASLLADQPTPTSTSTAPGSLSAGLGPADCTAAVRVHDNKHNICATWVNDAPNFLAPGQLFTGPFNFSYDSIDAGGDTAHHINKYPDPWFGASTWAATSAATNYGASMNWVFSSKEPADTITGAATQDKDNDHNAGCNGVQGYIACFVTRSDMTAVDGDRVHNVTYDLINAPLTVVIANNTGQQMTAVGSTALSNLLGSPKGTSGTGSIAPSGGGPAKTATFGGYRRTGGQAASFKAVYAFPDTANRAVTHQVTIDIEMLPNKTSDFRTWGVDTSRSTCTDNPLGGSSPDKAQCTLAGWTGNLSWFASAAVTVNVYNT